MRRPSLDQVNERLDRRRASRPDFSIETVVRELTTRVERTDRARLAFIAAWDAVMPPEIVRRTRVTSVRSGMAHVTVDSSSTAYEIDRLLRSGAEGELRRRLRAPLSRVRTRVGPVDDPRLTPPRPRRTRAAPDEA